MFFVDMMKTTEDDIAAIDADVKDVQKQMETLKVVLYAKFGKTINLELDPEE